MTGFVINLTGFVGNLTRFDGNDDNKSNIRAYITDLKVSCFQN